MQHGVPDVLDREDIPENGTKQRRTATYTPVIEVERGRLNYLHAAFSFQRGEARVFGDGVDRNSQLLCTTETALKSSSALITEG